MPDLLDQSEVDALLAAVEGTGGGSGSGNDAGMSSSRGINRVFGKSDVSPSDVLLYDFKRPERVSKDQMRALSALHEGFSRNFGASLSGYLRTIVEVSVAHLEQLTYSEFIHSLPNPTCFNLLKADQLEGQICLEISPLIIYPIIDRLLGGSSAQLFIPQRPLTQIEQRLVEKITERATANLSEAWSNLSPLTFSVSDFESNPQLVQIVPPNETVVLVGFELKMGNRAGTMSLCIPYNTIEPIMAQLSQQSWFSYQKKGVDDDSQQKIKKNINSAKLEMTAVLAHTTMKVSDLIGMQIGDIITTDKPTDTEVTVEVEGRTKFRGLLGKFRGGKAVRITGAAKHVD